MKLTPEEISWMDKYVLSECCRPSSGQVSSMDIEIYYMDALEFVLERRRVLYLIENLPEEE